MIAVPKLALHDRWGHLLVQVPSRPTDYAPRPEVVAWCDAMVPGWGLDKAKKGDDQMWGYQSRFPVMKFKTDADKLLFVMHWQRPANEDDEDEEDC